MEKTPNNGQQQLPLVSISCITYNHAPYIRQCLEGFMMQKTNFAFEVLIHDDASTDGTTEIIKEYKAKYPDIIKPLYEEENQWVKGRRGSAVFNYPRAKGKYIALCEGDDYWTDPLKLQKQVDFLEANPEYSIVHTSFSFLREDNGGTLENVTDIAKKNIEIQKNDYSNIIMHILDDNSYRIQTMTVVFRYEIYERIEKKRLASENISFMMGDTPLWVRLCSLGKIHFIPDNTAVYRVHMGSLCRPVTEISRLKFLLSSLEMRIYFSKCYKIKSLYKKNCRRYKKEINK